MLVICAVFISYVSSQKGDCGKKTITYVPYGFIMRSKHFAGNFSPCVVTNNGKVSKPVLEEPCIR